LSKHNLLSPSDVSRDELEQLLTRASELKGADNSQDLAGKTLGMLFFDPSLRTRVSFDVAMTQLGGHCIQIDADREIYDLEPQEQVVMDGAAEEHVKDAARTLSRYVDVLGVRHVSRTTDWQRDRQDLLLRSYAEHASVPVINLESMQQHPCQAIADVMTIKEKLGNTKNRKLTIAWSNHPEAKSMGVAHSTAISAAMVGMDITLAYPLGFELDGEVVDEVRNHTDKSGGSLALVNDLEAGVRGCDVLYSRSWGSQKYWNDPEREAQVKRSLESWCIDQAVMQRTNDALFMHSLPVRRNVVATDEVLDSSQSVIYDQAENRKYIQKALLLQLLQ